jgi:hypothetical protein
MDSSGMVNINVQTKFMKLWYKKREITLQDISLIRQQGPKVAHEKVIIGKQIAVPTDT